MPAGEMRRSDRKMDSRQCNALLDRALVCRVATADSTGAPYVVPMSFVFEPESGLIFIHCASSGHLLDNIREDGRVCFEVDEPGEVIATGEYACDTSQVYESVICFGEARVLDGPEKRRALESLVQKYVDRLDPGRAYDPELTTIDATVAIAIAVDTMTGKRRPAL